MAGAKRTKKVTPKVTPKKGARKRPPRNWREVFLNELARTGNVSASAKKAKRSRKTVYQERDPRGKDKVGMETAQAFAEAWDEALEVAADLLELEGHRRAVDGWLEPKFYRGKRCGTVRKYSDTLLIFLLKGIRPDKYRENVNLNVNWRQAAKDAGIADPDAFYEEIVRQIRQRMDRPGAGDGVPGSPLSTSGTGERPPDA